MREIQSSIRDYQNSFKDKKDPGKNNKEGLTNIVRAHCVKHVYLHNIVIFAILSREHITLSKWRTI
jgi:hypothetical protein